MRYVSTRGGGAPVRFRTALMAGQAADGGLLMPERLPDLSGRLEAWRALSYPALAFEILRLFADDVPEADLRGLIDRSYFHAREEGGAGFDTPEIVPLVPLGDLYLLELFHGPTLAFKDLALQLLGHLFDYELERSGATLNVLGATSGDTGSAAIAALRGKANVRVFILFPQGRTSRLQELQMTTVPDANVHCIAVEGTFDDCQRIMKSLFSDAAFKTRWSLGAINSVNCVRLLAQIVYYFHAWLRLPALGGEGRGSASRQGGRVTFSVPTGNFGDVFAGFLAAEMGLPVERLILATNENDILDRFFRTGVYRRGEVRRTLSPSMDIQAASNFERFLWWRFDRDAAAVRAFLAAFEAAGEARVETGGGRPAAGRLTSGRADRAATLAAIERWYREAGYLLDPHTAVGVAVAEEMLGGGRAGRRGRWAGTAEVASGRARDSAPVVCLATAHPGKFPDARPDGATAEHPRLAGLEALPARKVVLPNDAAQVARHLEAVCSRA